MTPGGSLVLSGVLTSARIGPLAGKTLAVLAHLPDRPWIVVTKATTCSDGSYTVRLRQYASATWKVRWSGVVTSPRRSVPVGEGRGGAAQVRRFSSDSASALVRAGVPSSPHGLYDGLAMESHHPTTYQGRRTESPGGSLQVRADDRWCRRSAAE